MSEYPPWISIEDELPPNGKIVLCCDMYNTFVSLGRYWEHEGIFDLLSLDSIEIDTAATHWMWLPTLPRGDE